MSQITQLIAALLVLLLSGCSVMSHQQVEGWPRLEIVEHYVKHDQMVERCARYVGFGMVPAACAEFDLAGGKCHIWFSSESMTPRFIVEHERLHCAGFDHVGSTNMRNALARWNAR